MYICIVIGRLTQQQKQIYTMKKSIFHSSAGHPAHNSRNISATSKSVLSVRKSTVNKSEVVKIGFVALGVLLFLGALTYNAIANGI